MNGYRISLTRFGVQNLFRIDEKGWVKYNKAVSRLLISNQFFNFGGEF